jgi:ribosome-associated protein
MTMLIVNDQIAIPLEEFRIEFARSGGPGGQNVNKVASKAVLRWSPADSPSLPGPVRDRLLRLLAARLTGAGELLVTSQRTRDQGRNVADCLDKVRRLVLAVASPPKPRRPTRPTLGSKVRRVEAKVRRSRAKDLRRKPELE